MTCSVSGPSSLVETDVEVIVNNNTTRLLLLDRRRRSPLLVHRFRRCPCAPCSALSLPGILVSALSVAPPPPGDDSCLSPGKTTARLGQGSCRRRPRVREPPEQVESHGAWLAACPEALPSSRKSACRWSSSLRGSLALARCACLRAQVLVYLGARLSALLSCET